MATTTEDIIISEVSYVLEEVLSRSSIYTPEFLAQKFINLTHDKQAEFFDHIGNDLALWILIKDSLSDNVKKLLLADKLINEQANNNKS